MTDYRVHISVRNARLLRTIEQAGHRPGAQFAKAAGINYARELLPYLNLTRSPLTPDGLLRECAWALCDFLNASPSELWSDAQLQPLTKNRSSIDLDADSVQALACGTTSVDPLRLASHAQAGRILQDAIDALTPNEACVIRERFFGDATHEQLAERIGLSKSRVQQIEKKALRKLRHPSRVPRELADVVDVIGGSADA